MGFSARLHDTENGDTLSRKFGVDFDHDQNVLMRFIGMSVAGDF